MKNATKNRIPRAFSRITGEMLINTSCDKPGDVLHVFKNDYGYLALNTRTGIYAYAFPSMLRDASIFKITEVLQ